MKDIGVRRVYYSTGNDDEIIYEIVSDMVSTHLSYGYKIVNTVSNKNYQKTKKINKKSQKNQKNQNTTKISNEINKEYTAYDYLKWWFLNIPSKKGIKNFMFILNMEILIRYPQGNIDLKKINENKYYICIDDPSKKLKFETTFKINKN